MKTKVAEIVRAKVKVGDWLKDIETSNVTINH